jgi:hypothetical protein
MQLRKVRYVNQGIIIPIIAFLAWLCTVPCQCAINAYGLDDWGSILDEMFVLCQFPCFASPSLQFCEAYLEYYSEAW